MNTQILSCSHPDAIDRAREVLTKGGLVAFPTDTVYGLAASLSIPAGIDRLYEVKSRTANKAIAVLIAELDQLALLTPGLTPSAQRLAERFWPGALTLVLPKRPELPANLSPLPTVGVRMPDHAFDRALIRTTGPLPTTSANISGEANPLTAQDVMEYLAGLIELVLDGGIVSGGVPSTVVDCNTHPPSILRAGAISAVEILDVSDQI